MDIIDRRLNPPGKSTENRRRVLARAKEALARAARDAVANGSIREIGRGGEGMEDGAVAIPAGTLHEPGFHAVFAAGRRQLVLPGNETFVVGDELRRPEGQGGAGGGGEAGDGGGGEDQFRFVLSRDEFLDLFFEDLELPDLLKRQVAEAEAATPARAGVSADGSPSQLDMGRSMQRSMARRIGLRRPRTEAVRALEAEIAALEQSRADPDRLRLLRAELELALRRLARVPWIDPLDLRYRRFAPRPRPAARAVMFCLMDVSGSMTEAMKDLAKRFFLLLHVFLERRYERVDLVFVRHTETAEEVDEATFFGDRRTGGTVVSTALAEMLRIQRARYPASAWNVYVAQASDGDNYATDTARAVAMLENEILPAVQHFAYIEVSHGGAGARGQTDLWRGYEALAARAPTLAMRRVGEKRDIFPVFRDLFARRPATQKVGA